MHLRSKDLGVLDLFNTIEISSNVKIVNFLDVTLDQSNNSYKPFIKTNQNPSYINVNSNHPKNIIKQIPKAVNLRIGKLSANEKIFKESSKKYIDALKNSGFKEDYRYLKEVITNEITKENNTYDQKNKSRKRKIIWFNPPFCKLANIDVGKYFLRPIDKHFKQDNILHKIFNRKTLKISYSCTKNMSQIMNSHDNELINKFHCPVGWGCRIHRLHLCRGVRPPPPTSVLDMTVNHLMVRFQQCRSFGECGVPLHCHRSQVHSGPEW